MKKKIALILALVLVMGILAGCGSSKNDGKLAEIQKRGKLIMATDAAWAPFEYIGPDGKPTGSDVVLAEYIAKELGVELEVINVAFDSLSSYLTSGEADMAIAAMTITEERKESMAFSNPYTSTEQYMVVLEGSGIETVEDLAGMGVGVHLGTTGDFLISDEIASGVLAGTGASVSQYAALPTACQDLKAGNLGAIVCDALLAQNLAKINEGCVAFPVAFATKEVEVEEYGIAMAKGDDAFVAKVNEIIAPIVADGTISGWIDEHTELASQLD